ncbi:hypothetical protein GK047_26835 [Paenibacillus sp. SYP-B3998]|uniref:Uncharacterized protein n=1 Tax=Paenibacillus sp. SYP-B3998 TaxID=2678564 RepID=A0A6G4A588_9BACL|nr:hypothetical protein [Paenibacillus sp. SYP-B3998]NEW09555.1 hypothetical protein [Paenibacillus sp. SYP-B3998]
MAWSYWSLDRVVILYVGLAYVFIWMQVTMSHYKINFYKKAMWGPVILAPLICLISILTVLLNSKGWLFTAQLFYWFGTLEGLIGFFFHIRGVGQRVGGYALRNFLTGPPVMMPLLFSAVSILGLIAVYGG